MKKLYKKILTVAGVIAAAFMVFIFGYAVGKTPTSSDQTAKTQQGAYIQTLQMINGKYSQLFTLCEAKYQSAITGHMDNAYQLKGQMDQVQSELKSSQAPL